MDAALNTWGGGVTGAGAKSPSPPAMVAEVVTATRRVAFTPALGSAARDLDPKRRTADAAALQETAAEDAMAAMLCSRERFEERPRVGTVAHRTLARGRARRSREEDGPSCFCDVELEPGGNLRSTAIVSFVRLVDHTKKPDAAKFFHLSCGIFFFRPVILGSSREFWTSQAAAKKQHAVANRRTRCQIKVFVGVWPSSAWAWLREAHWKERARIDAAPCPERKAFDTEEWLRERTELLRRGTARSQAVASPSSACLIWFQVESDESRGRLTSSIARHRRPLEVEHHGVLGVQRSEPGAGRRTTPFPRTRTPRALPTRAARGWREI